MTFFKYEHCLELKKRSIIKCLMLLIYFTPDFTPNEVSPWSNSNIIKNKPNLEIKFFKEHEFANITNRTGLLHSSLPSILTVCTDNKSFKLGSV